MSNVILRSCELICFACVSHARFLPLPFTMPASSPGQRANAFDNNPETIAMECVKFNGLGSPHDSDDESEDNGDVALLRSRPRFSSPTGLWLQTKNIVLEVGTLSLKSSR